MATIFVIFLGWILTKKQKFKPTWDVVFIKVLVTLGLPCLVFDGFMSDTSVEQVKTECAVLLTGFLFYLIMLVIARYFYLQYDKDVQDALGMSMTFAATSFFGIPIVTALFPGSESKIASNIFNVPYHIFLYSLGFIIMGKVNHPVHISTDQPVKAVNKFVYVGQMLKLNYKKIFFNPILIATIIGFIFWVTQLIPGINVVPDQIKNSSAKYSPLRLDNTFPPLFTVTKTLAGVCTPLAWLAIGINLTKGKITHILKDPKVWYGTIMKTLIAPVIGLGLTCLVALIGKATGAWTTSTMGLTIIVIMLAAPPASVIVAYSINFNKETLLTSNLTLVSTLISIIALPFWIIITTALGATSLFS
ncbi:AEC family transporter [Spiroplasma sp. DGKH1]|uniref:AEC family transporter n=1 Tax=Spiroplasma sp. DGKH1 TaxID=3050074 RepID=UPI0034C5C086